MMPRLNNKILVIVVCLAVAIVLVGGFMLAGSPQTAREQQMDMIRSNNLQNISYLIDSYAQSQKMMPASLAALYSTDGNLTGFVDPVTAQPYEYSIGDRDYKLCASFDKVGSDQNYRGEAPEISPNFYIHGEGRTCFTVLMPVLKIPALPLK